jgi:hypothetical protein
MKDLKEYIIEGVFDVDDNIDNLELIDLYSLIKDRIKTINYQYNWLGITHFLDNKKCNKFTKNHNIEPLKTIKGKKMSSALLSNLLPIILKEIIVNKDFITHKDDTSYAWRSVEISSKIIEDNDLIIHNDPNAKSYMASSYGHAQKYVAFSIVMKKGALLIYYDTVSNLSNFKLDGPGAGYISIRLV